jgi:hypothetical protein
MNSEWTEVSYKNKRAQRGAQPATGGAQKAAQPATGGAQRASQPATGGAQKAAQPATGGAQRGAQPATQVKQNNLLIWQQKRLLKIQKYDQEYPILPGTKDLVPEKIKVQWYDQQQELRRQQAQLRRQQEHQAYLLRKSKREDKLKQQKALHIQNMIEKWGVHRWHRMVDRTDDDCDEAYDLRSQEEMEEYERENRLKEQMEMDDKLRQEYIDKSTLGMTPKQKEKWLNDFEEEEFLEMCDEVDYEWFPSYDYFDKLAQQKRRDQERLDLWNLKQAIKTKI